MQTVTWIVASVILSAFVLAAVIIHGYSTAEKHHDRVAAFYGTLITDYHEYNMGYLTFGLWRDSKGNDIPNYTAAAENLFSEVADRIHLNEHSKVLDVACGMASQSIFLYKKYKSNITGLDLTPAHVTIGNQRLKKLGLNDKIHLLEGSATKLPFPNETFTHVYCIEGLPHFHTREDFFRETFRVLKPGGKFGYSDVTLPFVPSKYNVIAHALIWATSYLWTACVDNIYDNTEYKLKLDKLGFEDVKMTHHNHDVFQQYQVNSYADSEKLYKIRGFIGTWGGNLIDYMLAVLSRADYMDYILVSGTKPL